MATAPVSRFVHALEQYMVAEKEQHMRFATRKPADLGEADAEVRAALRDLIADIG